MKPAVTVLVASNNRGKLHELRALLGDLPIELVPAAQILRDAAVVAETGKTFEENALLKAMAVGKAAVMVTLADDSGLEVDALGGRPGVRSARFAREGATDAENNGALLSAMAELEPQSQRSARFRCVLALYDPWNEARPVTITEGRCDGSIAREPRGAGGFGYDPLFLVDGASGGPAGEGRTMAELSLEEKNSVSHRARAVRAMLPALRDLAHARLEQVRRVLG